MIRRFLFLCVLLPMTLALAVAPLCAAPISAQVGAARAMIAVSPDPPQVGTDAVTVTLSDVSPAALARTTVRYATLMPSMNMSGPSGTAASIPGRPNAWRFDVPFGMAAPWTLRIQFSGGVTGSLTTNLIIASAAHASSAMKPATVTPVASGSSAAGSVMSSTGDAHAWRNATFALMAVILIGALVLWRNRSPVAIAMVVIAGLTIVGLAFAQSRGGSSSMDMASMQSERGSAPVPVTLATVGDDSSGKTISAPASVQPYFIQNIDARAPGVVSDLHAYTGDRVTAGQVIAHLNEPELQSNAQAAQAAAQAAQDDIVMANHDAMIARANLAAKQQQLAYWKAEIAREKSLLNQGAVSVQEYQNEQAQAGAARSGYSAAQAKLGGANASIQAAHAQADQAASNAQAQSITAGYTNVIVPDDSIVMKRLVDPGVYVQVGTPILQVAVINRLRVQAQVSQQNLAGVQIGTPIVITFADGNVLHSRISSVSPVVDPNTHTAIAEAIVPNPGERYQPGAFVHVILHERGTSPTHSFAVPSGAIVGGTTTAVWTDVHRTAHRVPVRVISDDGTTAQVTGDLRVGTRVVVIGAENLQEGQPIAESPP